MIVPSVKTEPNIFLNLVQSTGHVLGINPVVCNARDFVATLFPLPEKNRFVVANDVSAANILHPDLKLNAEEKTRPHWINAAVIVSSATFIGSFFLGGALPTLYMVGAASAYLSPKLRSRVASSYQDLSAKVGLHASLAVSLFKTRLLDEQQKSAAESFAEMIQPAIQKLADKSKPALKPYILATLNPIPKALANGVLGTLLKEGHILGLQLISHWQDTIENTSVEELAHIFQEVTDFLNDYELASRRLEGRVFKDRKEEEKAWAEAFGEKWHRAFCKNPEDFSNVQKALEGYVEEIKEKLQRILIPNPIQAPSSDNPAVLDVSMKLVDVAANGAVKFVDNEVNEMAHTFFQGVMMAAQSPTLLYKFIFKALEEASHYLEKNFGIQVLPSPTHDAHIIIDTEGCVRACSEKARKAHVKIGMKKDDVLKIYKEEELSFLAANPELNDHVLLIDNVGGGKFIVRAHSEKAKQYGIEVGMDASQAEQLYNLKSPSDQPVATLVKRGDADSDELFLGRLSLDQLLVRLLTSTWTSLPALAEKKLAQIPGMYLFLVMWHVMWYCMTPARKVACAGLNYLVPVPPLEQMAQQTADRFLMLLRTPALKVLFLRLLDRALELVAVSQQRAQQEVAGRSQNEVSAQDPIQDASLGEAVIALGKTLLFVADPLIAPIRNISKSRLISYPAKAAFWIMRKTVVLSAKAQDSRLGFLKNAVKKVVALEIQETVEIGFEAYQNVVHIVGQDQGFRPTLQKLMAVAYQTIADLHLVDPDQRRLNSATETWGQLVNESILLGVRAFLNLSMEAGKESYQLASEMGQIKAIVRSCTVAWTTSSPQSEELFNKLKPFIDSAVQKFRTKKDSLEIQLERAKLAAEQLGKKAKKFQEGRDQLWIGDDTNNIANDLKRHLVISTNHSNQQNPLAKFHTAWQKAIEWVQVTHAELEKEIKEQWEKTSTVADFRVQECHEMKRLLNFLNAVNNDLKNLEESKDSTKWLQALNEVDMGLQRTCELVHKAQWKEEARQADINRKIKDLNNNLALFSGFPLEYSESSLAQLVKKQKLGKIEQFLLDNRSIQIAEIKVQNFASSHMDRISQLETELEETKRGLIKSAIEKERYLNEIVDRMMQNLEDPVWAELQKIIKKRMKVEKCLEKSFGWQNWLIADKLGNAFYNTFVNWDARLYEKQEARNRLIVDICRFKPRLVETYDRKIAKLEGKVIQLEQEFLKLKHGLVEKHGVDPLWWIDRSGKELYPLLTTILYPLITKDILAESEESRNSEEE